MVESQVDVMISLFIPTPPSEGRGLSPDPSLFFQSVSDGYGGPGRRRLAARGGLAIGTCRWLDRAFLRVLGDMSEARQPGPQSAGRNVHYPDIVFGMLAT